MRKTSWSPLLYFYIFNNDNLLFNYINNYINIIYYIFEEKKVV